MQGPAGKERGPSGLREAMSSGAIGLELESQMCHLCELRDSTASTAASCYFVTKHLRTWWLEVTVVFISQGSVGGRCRSAESSLVRPWSAAGQLCSFSLLHLAFSNVQGLPWGNGAALDPVQMPHPPAGHPFRACSCCEGRGGAESPGATCYQSSGRNSETTVGFVGVCLQEEGPGMCFLVFSFPTNCDTQVGVKAAP